MAVDKQGSFAVKIFKPVFHSNAVQVSGLGHDVAHCGNALWAEPLLADELESDAALPCTWCEVKL